MSKPIVLLQHLPVFLTFTRTILVLVKISTAGI
jgi:hypothetical protein